MRRYKFRAECWSDAKEFIDLFIYSEHINRTIKIEATGILEVEVEFETGQSLEFLKRIFERIKDGHVMAETLAPVELYTGERG